MSSAGRSAADSGRRAGFTASPQPAPLTRGWLIADSDGAVCIGYPARLARAWL